MEREILSYCDDWSQNSLSFLIYEKVKDHKSNLNQVETSLTQIMDDEKLVFGVTGNTKTFDSLKKWFQPFEDMWAAVQRAKTKKQEWFNAKLKDIDPDQVDLLIKETSQVVRRIEREVYDYK